MEQILAFESIGYVELGSCYRMLTERFNIYVDGEWVGCKDRYTSGRLFDTWHSCYYIVCPDEVIPMLKQRWLVHEDEGGYFIAWGCDGFTDGDIIDTVRFIKIYQKHEQKTMARNLSYC